MTPERDVTRIVRSWLEEGVTALPDRVLDVVLDQVPATPQRRPWWPARRLPYMNNPIRIAVVAIAVVVLALVGINLIPKAAVVGGPTAPTPSPTPAPTLPSGQIPPGAYRSGDITYTLPAGWNTPESGSSTIFNADSNPPNGMAIDYQWAGGIPYVYGDPCHSQTTGRYVGSTVDSLVAAFVAQKRSTPVTPVDVTIGGFSGKEIDLMVPLDIKFDGPSSASQCDGGQYLAWGDGTGGGRWNQGPGQHDLLDILDVNGKTTVIQRSFYPANTTADLAELQAIVDSITIAPPSATPSVGANPSSTTSTNP